MFGPDPVMGHGPKPFAGIARQQNIMLAFQCLDNKLLSDWRSIRQLKKYEICFDLFGRDLDMVDPGQTFCQPFGHRMIIL